MSIVITTPTGKIGSALTERLLELGEKPLLIARDASKVQNYVKRGAQVKEGSHGDAQFLVQATKGADALFVLTPPDFQMKDVREHYRKFAEAAAQAMRENGIAHVVHLSSVGAELEEGTGPIVGLHLAEEILNDAGKNVTHLRPGYFMENTMAQIPSILQAGALFTTLPKGTPIPMVATRDIGLRAAELLSNRDWKGHRVVELQSPDETTYDEVAGTLSDVLGRKIQHVTVSDDQLKQALNEMGVGDAMAEAFVELNQALAAGKIKFHEPQRDANTADTTYPSFASQVYKPAIEAASTQN